MKHPLFIGGVCLDCKKSVKKIEMGKTKEICVVCGLGGELVLCSLSNCLRSYCNVCLDYMAVKDSYSKILKNDNWRCYFCELNPDPRCFIKRREHFQSVAVELPAVPEEKLPICVMASNDAVLSILMKKKFEIGVYRTETANKPEPAIGKKFAEIRPDLIYGSFFASSISFYPSSSTDDRKTCLDAFAAAFYRFLFRLDNARLCKPFVDPVKIELSSKYLYLWTNVPPFNRLCRYLPTRILLFPWVLFCPLELNPEDRKLLDWLIGRGKAEGLSGACRQSPDGGKNFKNNTYSLKEKDSSTIEEDILNKFLDPLKVYFKQV
ncbi:hypothetical protein TNIN_448511 [Trichonephila inaurata madagascariensis]|uniref:PHD-type domain-containing protein n=1 Tax=Trichonephila inaurata madagascariensis TaxID=2747483 RepID=A0A8X7CDJ6_9ARAC|nr:hypothetical protein TNIN_448511 [Trichonephila inaurata madagascariensis]